MFPTGDGYVNIAVGNDRLWQKFCEALGMTGEAVDPRYTTNADRNANKVALYEALEANLSQRTTADVVELLDKAGVPCGPIYDIAQVFADPQAIHAGMRRSTEHSTIGEISLTGFPYRVGGEDLLVRTPPPVLVNTPKRFSTNLASRRRRSPSPGGKRWTVLPRPTCARSFQENARADPSSCVHCPLKNGTCQLSARVGRYTIWHRICSMATCASSPDDGMGINRLPVQRCNHRMDVPK